jgi:hypothetical protein
LLLLEALEVDVTLDTTEELLDAPPVLEALEVDVTLDATEELLDAPPAPVELAVDDVDPVSSMPLLQSDAVAASTAMITNSPPQCLVFDACVMSP